MKRQINIFKTVIIFFIILLNFILSQDKGLDFYNNQEFEAAKTYYESILQKSSSNSEAHLGRGSSSFQLGAFTTAKDAFFLNDCETNLLPSFFFPLIAKKISFLVTS